MNPPVPPTGAVELRDVTATDLPILFEHQRDPEAARMAAFPSREKHHFHAHWTRILADPSLGKQTILYDGQVAGNIVSFDQSGVRQVGYWIGREYWGKGIATRALALYLAYEPIRPLYAYVAKHNIGSRRVVEKCGFALVGEHQGTLDDGSPDVEEFIFRLA